MKPDVDVIIMQASCHFLMIIPRLGRGVDENPRVFSLIGLL